MIVTLKSIPASRAYWLALVFLGLAQLAVALFYQYARDELPCVLCIHVRVLISGFVLLSLFALLVRNSRWLLAAAHALNTAIMAGLVERAWILLGTERGTLISSCEFELGFPAWLAVDRWFPALYQVQASCGYTPELLFGVTMAEGLLVVFGVLLAVSTVLTAAALWQPRS